MASSTIGPFPTSGTPIDEVVRELDAKRDNDVRWAEGRTFGLVFDGGDEVRDVAERAARLFLHENALNTSAFPSLGEIQSELCGWTANLLHGPPETAGFLTSGGTESILCAVEAPGSGPGLNGRSPNPRSSWPRAPMPPSTRVHTSSACGPGWFR